MINTAKKTLLFPLLVLISTGAVAQQQKDTLSVSTIPQVDSMKAGSVFTLQNVYFALDRHTIKGDSKKTLNQLYIILRDHPSMKISIEGHVCCITAKVKDAYDADTNEPRLSITRAKAIYDYLVEKGIDKNRLRYEGFGRTRPVVVDEKTEADAQKNRRVEIRIVEQ